MAMGISSPGAAENKTSKILGSESPGELRKQNDSVKQARQPLEAVANLLRQGPNRHIIH